MKSLRGANEAELIEMMDANGAPAERRVRTVRAAWGCESSLPFLGCGLLLLLPGVDGLKSVLVSVLGLESLLGDRSVTAESSEARESFRALPPSGPR